MQWSNQGKLLEVGSFKRLPKRYTKVIKNKMGVQKIMIVSFMFVLSFNCILPHISLKKNMFGMNRTQSV